MDIKNIIVHEVQKDDGQNEAQLILREVENPINSHAKFLTDELSRLFQKTGLSSGRFKQSNNEDDPKPHFVALLEKYFDQTSFGSFISFSKAAANEFKRNLDRSGPSKGGYLWFNHYIHNENNFLSIVLLRKKPGMTLSSNLDLSAIEQLDLDKLHMAARINLSKWLKGNSEKYIAFRIGSNARDITDYFLNFIGCEEYTRSREDTQNLVNIVKQYCSAHNFDSSKTEEVKEFIYITCTDWDKNQESILIDKISTLLDTKFVRKSEEHGKFLEIAQNDPFSLNYEIRLDKTALKSLKRYSFKTKQISVSFDSDLLNHSVIFDREKKELIFTDLPDDFISQFEQIVS